MPGFDNDGVVIPLPEPVSHLLQRWHLLSQLTVTNAPVVMMS